jgi:hypothetical protein
MDTEPQKPERGNLWKEMAKKWETLPTAQKAYIGSLALMTGVNILDTATTMAGLSSGNFQEAGLIARPMLELCGAAGLWMTGAALTIIEMLGTKVVSMAAKLDNLPGKEYYGTAAAVAFSAIAAAPVIHNALLVK